MRQHFKIADIGLSLRSRDDLAWDTDDAFRRFEINGEESSPMVNLSVNLGNNASSSQSDEWLQVFDSEGLWYLEKNLTQNQWKLTLSLPLHRHPPYQVATYNENFTEGELVLHRHSSDPEFQHGFPLAFPAGEVLLINLLGRGRGAMLHACGVSVEDRGLLFVGTSGAGKSTIAGLWSQVPGARVLSDDRIIVRRQSGQFWLHGTPFHGTAKYAEPEAVPLERVCFLHHSVTNWVKDVSPVSAAAQLLARSFPPMWDREGAQFTLDFVSDVSLNTVCCDLGFRPDQTITDFLTNML